MEAPRTLTLAGVDSSGRSAVGSLNSLDSAVCNLAIVMSVNGLCEVRTEDAGECIIVRNNDPSDVVVTFTVE